MKPRTRLPSHPGGGGPSLSPPALPAPMPSHRDVSSVELLMNDHQGLKSEIEARGKSIAACLELGKNLILSKSPAADEVPTVEGGRQLGGGGCNC